MKNIFDRLTLLLLTSVISSQTAIQAQFKYDQFPAEKHLVIWLEEFEDNSKNWPTELPNSKVQIKKGKYKRTHSNGYLIEASGIPVEIPEEEDFEITVKINTPEDRFTAHAFYWGGENDGALKSYVFAFNTRGEVMFGKSANRDVQTITTNLYSREKITLESTNEMKIRHIAGTYYFFFNKKYFYHSSKSDFFGKYISVGALGRASTVICSKIEVALLQVDKKIAIDRIQLITPSGKPVIKPGDRFKIRFEARNLSEVYLYDVSARIHYNGENRAISGIPLWPVKEFGSNVETFEMNLYADYNLEAEENKRFTIYIGSGKNWYSDSTELLQTKGFQKSSNWKMPPDVGAAEGISKIRLKALEHALLAGKYNPGETKRLLEEAIIQGDTLALLWKAYLLQNGFANAYPKDTEAAISIVEPLTDYLIGMAGCTDIESLYLVFFSMLSDAKKSHLHEYVFGKMGTMAQMGYLPAMLSHSMALTTRKKYEEAVSLLTASEQKGAVKAYSTLATLYLNGDGVPKDTDKARAYFQQAAKAGDSDAWILLAKANFDKQSSVFDTVQAIANFEKAIAMGNTQAMTELGRWYNRGDAINRPDDRAKAYKLFEQAAKMNNRDAMFHLGGMDYVGWNREGQRNTEKGLAWITRAAEAGQLWAMPLLSIGYGEGEGLEKNQVKSRYWMSYAIENGYDSKREAPPEAPHFLAQAFCNLDWSPEYWLVRDRYGNERVEERSPNMFERGIEAMFETWVQSRINQQETINGIELVGKKGRMTVYGATVTSKFVSNVRVKKGDLLSIRVYGKVSFGMLTGAHTATGTNDDLLRRFSIDPTHPHGAFLVRFGSSQPWRYVGTRGQITADQDGYLELAVNDTDWTNNKGYFDARILIFNAASK